MTLDEAIKTIEYERNELHKKQLAGHHTWATGVLAAAIEMLPYAVEHQRWRYEFAGRAMQGMLMNAVEFGALSTEATASEAALAADALIAALQEDTC